MLVSDFFTVDLCQILEDLRSNVEYKKRMVEKWSNEGDAMREMAAFDAMIALEHAVTKLRNVLEYHKVIS